MPECQNASRMRYYRRTIISWKIWVINRDLKMSSTKSTIATSRHGKVDKVDRGPLDAPLLPCVVVEITENNYARVACKGGVLKSCFFRETLITDTCSGSRLHQFGLENHVQNWRQLPVISIRQGATFDSPLGGQGFFKCSCHGACDSNRCACKKADVLCGSRCHKGANGACKNCEAAMVFKKPKSN